MACACACECACSNASLRSAQVGGIISCLVQKIMCGVILIGMDMVGTLDRHNVLNHTFVCLLPVEKYF